jgi:hypothetical protein
MLSQSTLDTNTPPFEAHTEVYANPKTFKHYKTSVSTVSLSRIEIGSQHAKHDKPNACKVWSEMVKDDFSPQDTNSETNRFEFDIDD